MEKKLSDFQSRIRPDKDNYLCKETENNEKRKF